MLIHTGIIVYMIVTLEQMMARNQSPDEEREWTFGQVLAVFLLLGVVVGGKAMIMMIWGWR